MEIFVAGCSTSWTSRYNSCYMIDKHIVFDAGGGTVKNLVRHFGEKQIQKVDTVFISHFHGDHIFGIGYFLSSAARHYKENGRLRVVSQKGLRKALNALLPFCTTKKVDLDDFLEIIEIKDKQSIKVGKYNVTAYKLNHGTCDDLGFLIDDGKQKFGYTGDTCFDEKLQNFIKDCDSAMCDVSAMKNETNHMGVDGFKQLEKMFPEKNLYAIHCTGPVFESAKKLNIKILRESKCYVFENKKLKQKTMKKVKNS